MDLEQDWTLFKMNESEVKNKNYFYIFKKYTNIFETILFYF